MQLALRIRIAAGLFSYCGNFRIFRVVEHHCDDYCRFNVTILSCNTKYLMAVPTNICTNKNYPLYGTYITHVFCVVCRAKHCKYFDMGKGTCSFGSSCFYRHGEWVLLHA